MSLALNRSVDDAEIGFLEKMRPFYEERGYRFTVHPLPADIPEFLVYHRPDAVASRENDNIAIKLISRAPGGVRSSIVELRNLIKDHPDWSLTVTHMGSGPSDKHEMPVVGKDAILLRAEEAEQLAEEGHEAAAFIMAWSLLEATLNSLHPSADKRPRTPGTVVQTLSMNGDISYEAEKDLRPLVELRNRVVHGDLGAMPNVDEVRHVLSAVRAALTEPAIDAVS